MAAVVPRGTMHGLLALVTGVAAIWGSSRRRRRVCWSGAMPMAHCKMLHAGMQCCMLCCVVQDVLVLEFEAVFGAPDMDVPHA